MFSSVRFNFMRIRYISASTLGVELRSLCLLWDRNSCSGDASLAPCSITEMSTQKAEALFDFEPTAKVELKIRVRAHQAT